jgi:hypothetical protein
VIAAGNLSAAIRERGNEKTNTCRVAERIGEREQAIQSYSWVVGMWRRPDPELEPYVAEARDGLARLTAEKR